MQVEIFMKFGIGSQVKAGTKAHTDKQRKIARLRFIPINQLKASCYFIKRAN